MTEVANTSVLPARSTFPEIDIWRGLAALFMVLNHAGFALLAQDTRDSSGVKFFLHLTSHAPVLFFFITGFGSGISRYENKAARDTINTAWKVVILFTMDLLLRLSSNGDILGWDFLGFIALAILCLHSIQASRCPTFLAAALFITLAAARFIAAPALNKIYPEDQELEWLKVLLGSESFSGISYWPAPWLCYPLLGFVLGYAFSRFRHLFPDKPETKKRLLLICIVLSLPTIAVLLLQMPYFRWGKVSIAFFISSFAMLAWTYLLALHLANIGRSLPWINFLQLRGINSLLVVPIHYTILELVGEMGWATALESASFFFASLLIVGGSFWIANTIGRITRSASLKIPLNIAAVYITGVVIALFSFLYLRESGLHALGLLFAATLISPLVTFQPRRRSPR